MPKNINNRFLVFSFSQKEWYGFFAVFCFLEKNSLIFDCEFWARSPEICFWFKQL